MVLCAKCTRRSLADVGMDITDRTAVTTPMELAATWENTPGRTVSFPHEREYSTPSTPFPILRVTAHNGQSVGIFYPVAHELMHFVKVHYLNDFYAKRAEMRNRAPLGERGAITDHEVAVAVLRDDPRVRGLIVGVAVPHHNAALSKSTYYLTVSTSTDLLYGPYRNYNRTHLKLHPLEEALRGFVAACGDIVDLKWESIASPDNMTLSAREWHINPEDPELWNIAQ